MAPGRRPNGSGMWLPGGTRPAPERLRDVAPGYHLDRSRTGAQTYLYPGLFCGTGTRVSAAGHSILFAATHDADLCHLFCPGAKNRAFSFAPGQKTEPSPLPRGKIPSLLLCPGAKSRVSSFCPGAKKRVSSFCPGQKLNLRTWQDELQSLPTWNSHACSVDRGKDAGDRPRRARLAVGWPSAMGC